MSVSVLGGGGRKRPVSFAELLRAVPQSWTIQKIMTIKTIVRLLLLVPAILSYLHSAGSFLRHEWPIAACYVLETMMWLLAVIVVSVWSTPSMELK